jgi:8-oxo-dGTP pyrophosphatase MutT (NUDIX family)
VTADPAPRIERAADPDSVVVRPAATVMLVRDAPPPEVGVEVFMLRRVGSSSFAAGMYVFPGGRVDDVDRADELAPYCTGLDDAVASAALGIDHGGLAYWVAAVRECFEESGLLLAHARGGGDPDVDPDDRRAVHAGELSMVELCRRRDLMLDLGGIRYVAHWVTPRGEPRRFDTRFFLALAPQGQDGLHDDAETDDSQWVRPADAIARWRARELAMMAPTVASLRSLAECRSAAAALEATDAVGPPPRIEPRLRVSDTGKITGVALPDDPDYASLA